MSEWHFEGRRRESVGQNGKDDIGEWRVAGAVGYAKTQPLPMPGNARLMIRFEARTDKLATPLASVFSREINIAP